MAHNLPSGYTELEYIESTGTQYIDTGYIPDQDGGFYIDFIPMDNITKTNASQYVNAGGRSGENRITLGAYQQHPGGDFIWNNMNTIDPTIVKNVRMTFRLQSKKVYINNGNPLNTNSSIFTCNNSLIIFAAHTLNAPVDRFGKCKLYSFKVLYRNDIIKDLVPAKDSNDVIGLYDVLNDVFLTNSGTGTFTAGPEVEPEPEPTPVVVTTSKQEIDWSESMEQTFEYYEVDPHSWKDKKRLDTVKKASIRRDLESDTLGSATIDVDDLLGECYVRIYLIARQNGGLFKVTLGTFIVQTPSSSYDGKIRSVSMDAYTPLLELKENPLPLGFALMKDDNIMREAYLLTRDNCRARVVETSLDKLLQDNFVADPSEKWLDYIHALLDQANYRFDVDAEGVIMFAPKQKTEALQPVWTFNDDNSSILSPQITMQHDLYGIPNVVEVTCDTGTSKYTARIVNDDPNSPTSTVNRGREILYREDDPNLPGYSTEEAINEYATKLLESLSSVEYQVSYTHGYCPVRVGDAVRLNYKRAGLENIKAKVINQTINCEKGCSVSETAVFTKKLWN